MSENGTPRVKLLGAEWDVTVGALSFFRRQELLSSGADNCGYDDPAQFGKYVACLGVTWAHPDIELPALKRPASRADVLDYADEVLLILQKAGAALSDLIQPGIVVWTAIAQSMLPQAEIEERADFSKASSATTPEASDDGTGSDAEPSDEAPPAPEPT